MIKETLKNIVISILTLEARFFLSRCKPKIVAITGSVGKTTAKDAIAIVLAKSFSVRKSEKSFNSEFGVPLAILGLQSGWSSFLWWLAILVRGCFRAWSTSACPEWIVLEVGTDAPGDIEKIARWIKPDIVVLTAFPAVPVHVEFFSSPSAVIAEKMNLVRSLKQDGTLILNADNEKVLRETQSSPSNKLLYGFAPNATVRAKGFRYLTHHGTTRGVSATITKDTESVTLQLLGVAGKQHILSCLAGVTVGVSLGIPVAKAVEAYSSYTPPSGRMRLVEGIKNSLILDDSYNSSPVALEEALNTLRDMPKQGRKIVILGDMLELGNYSINEHRKAGEYVAGIADFVLTVGVRSYATQKVVLAKGISEDNAKHFDEARLAGKYVEQMIERGDVVLIKGSQSMRMERAVKEIMAHPENAKDLLVRQEDEWLKRV
jgi:UDP-N-acetylmuramoyl-tripeptide--D-alanyl-D-alanine ligase